MQDFNLKKTLKVYAITDRRYILHNNYTIGEAVENAIKGGATIIQLREKELDFDLFLKQAISLKKITEIVPTIQLLQNSKQKKNYF